MLNSFVFLYLKDFLIFFKTPEEHVQHVRMVPQRLNGHHLEVKLEKCEFQTSSIAFLGHVFSLAEMDQDKNKAVQEWPQPTTLKQVQCF